MPDGTQLAARIWLPADAGTNPVPAILEYIPYRKRDEMVERDEALHPHFASHGYACLRVDLRGSGDSDGELVDEYTAQEHQDCLEIFNWLTAQSWCDGKVGMMGISWGGFNALQIAALGPGALKAVIAVAATHNRFTDDVHFMGGALLTNNLTWSQKLMADATRPPDPMIVGDRWRQMWLDRMNREQLFIEPWLNHQTYDEFWQHGSVCEDYAAIKIPVLSVAAWADSYSNFVPQLLANLDGPHRAIVGPWAHHYPHLGRPGPAIDFLQECVRWWDHWLKGLDTGVMAEPAWRVYVQENLSASPSHAVREGRWVGVDQWPPVDPQERVLHVGPHGLGFEPSAGKKIDLSTPQNLGAMSGEWCPYAIDDQSGDQAADDGMALSFQSEPLAGRIDILGAAICMLDIVDCPGEGIVIVRLEDVGPSGQSARVSYGVCNLANPPRPPSINEATGNTRVEIVLNDTAYAFRAGHSIRLAISTTYWPTIWPSRRPTRIGISTGGSQLRLPLLTPAMIANTPVQFEPPYVPSESTVETLRPGAYRRSLQRDLITGSDLLTVSGDTGLRRFAPHGLEIGSAFEERYSIHPDDPLSARLAITWQSTLSRGDWAVRTDISTTMTATEHDFLIAAELTAFEREELVLTREWTVTIPRHTV